MVNTTQTMWHKHVSELYYQKGSLSLLQKSHPHTAVTGRKTSPRLPPLISQSMLPSPTSTASSVLPTKSVLTCLQLGLGTVGRAGVSLCGEPFLS